MTKILLTGGSGFIAAHILDQLLENGHSVVTTTRSEEKAQPIREAYKSKGDKLQVVAVGDISKADAFDEVVKTPGLEVVMHTASPFHFNFNDPKELINPALNGTTGILKAIKKSAPGVKRVIVTSSFASILDEAKLNDPSTTFTEKSWNPSTIEDVNRSKATAYRVSKTLAERAAWDFVANEKPNFDLVTICPPAVFGPVVHHLASLDTINTSNERMVALVRGEWANAIPSTVPVTLWVDVRDTALAHVRAMEIPEAGGKRLFTTAGRFTNREIASIARAKFPELAGKVPDEDVQGGEGPPKDQEFQYNNDETTKVLGMKWTSLESSVVDLIKIMKENHGI